MTDGITALRLEIADLARQFNEKIDDITETTGCTNPRHGAQRRLT